MSLDGIQNGAAGTRFPASGVSDHSLPLRPLHRRPNVLSVAIRVRKLIHFTRDHTCIRDGKPNCGLLTNALLCGRILRKAYEIYCLTCETETRSRADSQLE